MCHGRNAAGENKTEDQKQNRDKNNNNKTNTKSCRAENKLGEEDNQNVYRFFYSWNETFQPHRPKPASELNDLQKQKQQQQQQQLRGPLPLLQSSPSALPRSPIDFSCGSTLPPIFTSPCTSLSPAFTPSHPSLLALSSIPSPPFIFHTTLLSSIMDSLEISASCSGPRVPGASRVVLIPIKLR